MDDPRADLAHLAADCRCGNLAAYERLYNLQSRRMKSVAFHMLRSMPDAEDAVQETFLRIYRGIATYREESSFKTWIFHILMNVCRDALRRRQRRPEAELTEVREAANAPLAAAVLEQALGRLDDRRRMVFLLFETEGFSHSEIAAVMETSETNSRTLLFEAKRELRETLGN